MPRMLLAATGSLMLTGVLGFARLPVDECPITREHCSEDPNLPDNCNCGDCGYPACGDCDCDHYGDDYCCTGSSGYEDEDEECDIETSGDRSSSPSGTTNHGAGNGWCDSDLDSGIGCAASPGDCWERCSDGYGDGLVAVDWWDD